MNHQSAAAQGCAQAPPALRDYQEAAIAAIVEAAHAGVRRQLLSLSTGLGKTVIMARLPQALQLRRLSDVTLLVAHREELIDQAVAAFSRACGDAWIEIEKAEREANPMAQIVVGSIQTLQGRRLLDFLRRFGKRIALLLIDEAHHAASPSYVALYEAVRAQREDALVVGVTATPQRADNKALTACFDEVVFHRDITWAIDNGYLVPIHCYRVNSTTDLDAGTFGSGADFALEELGRLVDNDARNKTSVEAYLQHVPGKRALAFTSTVAHAEHLANAFCKAGVRAAWASAETEPSLRARTIERFKTGEVDVLVNCGLFLEGFDVPSTEVIINARPTKSSTLYTQIIGRGLRPSEEIADALGPGTTPAQRTRTIKESRKPFVTVLDIVDQSRKHSIVTVPSVMGLPPNIDAQGRDVRAVKRRYDQLATEHPHAIERLKACGTLTFSQMKIELERVEHFSVPEPDPQIAGVAILSWRRISGDAFRLVLPDRKIARDEHGAIIPDFHARFSRLAREARERGEPSPEEYACAYLGATITSLRTIHEAIEIRPDPLNRFECWQIRNGREKMLGKTCDFHDAIRRAERAVREGRPDVVRLLRLEGSWQKKKPTHKQIALLRRLGVPLELIPDSRGAASRLIEKLRDPRSASRRRLQGKT